MKYKTLGALVLALGIGLSAGGCRGGPSDSRALYSDYGLSTVDNKTVAGKIVKVQPSSISFIGEQRGYAFYGAYGSQNHEFEYVFVKDENNRIHKLIYPRSYGIIEGDAQINYVNIPGEMTADRFIKLYINEDYTTDDNFTLHADGIITREGIRYKQEGCRYGESHVNEKN